VKFFLYPVFSTFNKTSYIFSEQVIQKTLLIWHFETKYPPFTAKKIKVKNSLNFGN